jgi:hypothetical protein
MKIKEPKALIILEMPEYRKRGKYLNIPIFFLCSVLFLIVSLYFLYGLYMNAPAESETFSAGLNVISNLI